MRMELLQLEYFYAVAENLHVTKTAEQLHVAQPALTQSIHRLEGELGVKLFRKSGRNIALTECGEYMKEKLSSVLPVIHELPEQLQEMADIRRRTLRINVLAASTLVTEALILYQQLNPDVRFQAVQNAEDINADITVSTTENFTMPEESRDMFRIFTEHIFLAVPDTEEFRSMKRVCLSDMRDAGFISLAGSRTLRVICDRYCMQAGFTPKTVFESDSPAAVQNLIAAGLGVGFWPHYTWGRKEKKEILLLPISEPDCKRDIVLQLHHQSCAGQEERVRFFDFLGDYLHQQKVRMK
jgi:DNA-binding transcriptional LysR family regulator